MDTQTARKTRTITLTGRRPVTIVEAEWPREAHAEGDSWTSGDYSRYQQALSQGELDRYHLVVRHHADGRRLVYAVVDGASAWTGTEDYRGGEMLQSDGDVEAAIQRVGAEAVEHGMPESLIRDCLADLPAEEL